MGRGGLNDLLVAFGLQKMLSRDDQCNHKSLTMKIFAENVIAEFLAGVSTTIGLRLEKATTALTLA